jgi:hypothetical protein
MLSDYYLDKTTILGRRYPQFPARLPYLPAGYHACAAPPHACCERSQRYSEECAPDAPRTARRHQRCHLLCLSLSPSLPLMSPLTGATHEATVNLLNSEREPVLRRRGPARRKARTLVSLASRTTTTTRRRRRRRRRKKWRYRRVVVEDRS